MIICYISGALVSLFLMIKYHRNRFKENGIYYNFAASDLCFTLILTILSWIGVIIVCVSIGEYIILWKPKKRG